MSMTEDFVKTVKTVKGTTAATLTFETEPTMRKTGNPFVGRVKRVTCVNTMLGTSYAAKANGQSKGLPWGKRIAGTPLVEHKGQTYVQVVDPNTMRTHYLVPVMTFNLKGMKRAAIKGKVLKA
jgi:hypothetical protein